MQGRLVAGRYRLARVLGGGSTGSAWLAQDEVADREVVVKLLAAELAASPGARARFAREARLAASLDDPRIAHVCDHGVEDGGEAFLVMEYTLGVTLRERLSDEGLLGLSEVAALVGDLCRGLSAAHQAGLVHRDLKPENVLMAAEGEGDVVKILDFGSAKGADVLGDAGVDPTRTGDLVGTPSYMSPEQAQGLNTIDHRADLWAVGVIAFECMTGVRPFDAHALGPLIGKILAGPIPVPSQVAPDAHIQTSVDAWMARALTRSPAGRFASAAELADALGRAVQAAARSTDTDDELPLRQAWESGDMEVALRAAITRFGPEIFRYLGGLLGDAAVADDAFSIFCERLWSSLPRFEGRCSFRTWAYVIARRASTDVLRAEGRRGRRQTPLADSHIAEVAEQVRTATLPLLKTAGRTALSRLRDELPAEDKMLLVLRVDRGLAWEQMAHVFLDKESPTVAELRRESARLRKRFQLVKERLRERALEEGILDDE